MKARLWLALAVLGLVYALVAMNAWSAPANPQSSANSQLQIIGKDGKVTGFVPLKHTSVKTEISGFVARIAVTQEFENVLPEAIEATYVFPLPHDSAVDGMTMKVGDREIQAVIKEREEARKIYEAARTAGHTAALLDQERPNIFTQSVTNIPPNGKVEITLSVLELLKYEAGTYEFVFPTVVGPRYIPGNPAGQTGAIKQPAEGDASLQDAALRQQDGGTQQNTGQVPDASRITPPVAGFHTPDEHAGHDFSIDIKLAAGVPVAGVESASHKIFADRTGADSYHVQLADDAVLPNKDFILKYKVAGPGINDAVLTHADKASGYFTLILQPPASIPDNSVVPRELIFVLDTSGSMHGFPIETAKKTIRRALDNLRPEETFNLITFSGDTKILFPGPVPATKENIAAARRVLDGAYGSGGTEMMKAIRAALGDDVEPEKPKSGTQPLRVVCFMTDGYVGDDAAIVAEVQKHPESRVFGFGIGTAVNRFLLSKMSEEGHGEVEYVTSPNEAETAADRFYERVHSPVLTNITIDWKGLPVTEVYPTQVPDLFSAKPVIITGRYTQGATGSIVIYGTQAGGLFKRTVNVDFPGDNSSNAALEKIWARRKVEDLMSQDWEGIQQGNSKHKAEIIDVGLKHSLATQYTSFVAVEEKTVISDGKPLRIQVPVELPEHVSPLAVGGTVGGMFANAPAPAAGFSYSVTRSRVITSSGTNNTVEVTSDPPMIDTTQTQVSNTTIYAELKPQTDEKKTLAKMSAELKSLVACSKKAGVNKAGQCKLPASGMVAVEVQLTSADQSVIQLLEQTGLKLKSGSGTTTVTGEIPIAQLESLAGLEQVKSVTRASKDTAVMLIPPSRKNQEIAAGLR
ncbi:MAG: hypothetical protein DMG65_01225 [Candidatus Angelobacter sp. Gp1-AA117]|nr:MAG: hypothetical protein DMG65_01225 [Candidatus Angelobacter sp. Gp1-AA117]